MSNPHTEKQHLPQNFVKFNTMIWNVIKMWALSGMRTNLRVGTESIAKRKYSTAYKCYKLWMWGSPLWVRPSWRWRRCTLWVSMIDNQTYARESFPFAINTFYLSLSFLFSHSSLFSVFLPSSYFLHLYNSLYYICTISIE